jgi:hypothetical protein
MCVCVSVIVSACLFRFVNDTFHDCESLIVLCGVTSFAATVCS